MGVSSASDYIEIFKRMLTGERTTRTMNALATDYYLTHIRADFGDTAAQSAINSVRQHINYYEQVGKSSLPSLRALVEKHATLTSLQDDAQHLHEDFWKKVKEALADTPTARQQRLKSAPKIPEKIEVRTFVFKRNPDVVAEVLSRAGTTCEKCEQPAPFKRKANGHPYLEVHHKIQLANGGEDSIENATGLCPNCHREFHFG
ncbi:HNH endonuclease [Candidimonas sp. SYP-B2681]|nr:HNH endonuclease [Candidimonas sp. SYP-B2681]